MKMEKNIFVERSREISEAIWRYNFMLQKENKSREESWRFLMERKREIEEKYGVECGFEFLYPDFMFGVEESFEKHEEKLKKFREVYEESKGMKGGNIVRNSTYGKGGLAHGDF